jgi:hypothetical protein
MRDCTASFPPTSRRLAALAAAAAVSISLLAIAWHKVPCMYADSEHYINMAEGHPELVGKPFCSRVLEPMAVRMLCAVSRLNIHESFFVWGVVSLFALTAFVALTLSKAPAVGTAVLVFVTLCSPLLLDMFIRYYLPDLFHAALIAGFLLCVACAESRPRLWWIAYPVLLATWVARESTLLLSVCLVTKEVIRRRWRAVVAVLFVSVAGVVTVSIVSRTSTSNIHQMNDLAYLAMKMPFNFCRNVLGFMLWTNTYAAYQANYPAPVWTVDVPAWLRMGSVHRVGICAFQPELPLGSLKALLTMFGIAPTILVGTLTGNTREKLRSMPYWLSLSLFYGVLAYGMGIVVGSPVARMSAYGWPAFWIVAPFLLATCLRPSRREALQLVLCHLWVVWLPWLVSLTLGGSVGVLVVVVAAIAYPHVLAYRITRRLTAASEWHQKTGVGAPAYP